MAAEDLSPSERRQRDVREVVDRIAVQLRTRREARGLQSRLAARIGMEVSSLARIEKGHQRPKIDELLLIADELGVPLTELFGSFSVGRPDERGERLSNRDGDWRMVDRAAIAPGFVEQTISAGGADAWPHQHDGVERIYVQAGAVELVTGREKRVTRLLERESADFEAVMPHRLVNVGDAPAVVLRSMSSDGVRRHIP